MVTLLLQSNRDRCRACQISPSPCQNSLEPLQSWLVLFDFDDEPGPCKLVCKAQCTFRRVEFTCR
jgi:hypothetical protein